MTKKSLINDRIIEVCAENILAGMSYNSCAKAVNVSSSTWQNWIAWGREGRLPYSKFYIRIQEAEATLLKECLSAVKLSMKLGDVKSAYFLLQTRFADDGFSKKVNVQSENKNLNLNVSVPSSSEENDKIRAGILAKLQPKGKFSDYIE